MGLMEVQLKEIIDRIKHEGVRSAQEESDRIVAEARNKASTIVQKAEEDAKLIRNNAETEVRRMENSGRDALRQAGRDLILMVKEELRSVFNRLLEREVHDALSVELLADVIVVAVKNISKQQENGFEVLVPAELLGEIEPVLMARFRAALASGIEIKPFKGLDAGFRIAMKDGSAFYDFSDKEIAAMLSRHLNPRLISILTA